MIGRPLVTSIVATYNRAGLLGEALESLRTQTLADFEVLVIDDCSDDAEAVAAAVPSDPRFRLVRNEVRSGPSRARNRGIDMARGEYVAVLDDDDLAVPHRLERQVELLRQHADAAACFSAVQWFRGAREPVGIHPGIIAAGRWPEAPEDAFRVLYQESCKLPNTSAMFRRSVLGKLRYPEWTWIGEDWFLFLQMAALGLRMIAIPECLVWQRRDPSHESLVQKRRERWETEFLVLEHIRQWLADRGDHRFDAYHKLALSNAYARQALMVSRFAGIVLALKGIAACPSNGAPWRALGAILGRAARRAGRLAAGRVR